MSYRKNWTARPRDEVSGRRSSPWASSRDRGKTANQAAVHSASAARPMPARRAAETVFGASSGAGGVEAQQEQDADCGGGAMGRVGLHEQDMAGSSCCFSFGKIAIYYRKKTRPATKDDAPGA